jgi:hypothetical protein
MEQLNREEVIARKQVVSLGGQAIDQIFRTQDLLGIPRNDQPVVKQEHVDQEMVDAKPLALPDNFPFGATPEQVA